MHTVMCRVLSQSVQKPLNRERCTTFVVIVHIDVRLHAGFMVLSDDFHRGLQPVILRLHDLVPHPASPLLDLGTVRTMQPDHRERGGADIELFDYLCNPGHIVAVQHHKAETMLSKEIRELGFEVVGVADFDGVREAARSLLKEGVQPVQERRQRPHLMLVEVLELDHDWAELAVHRFEHLQEAVQEVHANPSSTVRSKRRIFRALIEGRVLVFGLISKG